jgi:hypothetical protein
LSHSANSAPKLLESLYKILLEDARRFREERKVEDMAKEKKKRETTLVL